MPDDTKRYVLARPLGGFNDMLCQLERVWRYCRAYGRAMVLDTSRSGIQDDLLAYFELADTGGVQVDSVLEKGWHVSTGSDGLIVGHQSDGMPLFERAWQEEEGFDLKRDHPDRVLVHPCFGGGDLGVHFLEKLRLRPEIRAELRHAIAPLGRDYLALHIRNTDWQTDYVAAFACLARKIAGRKVLVCSDDSRAIHYFRDTYGQVCDFVTTSELTNIDGKPLHYNAERDARGSNLTMLTDLYALAMGSQICMIDTHNGKRSGFAVLAAHMLRRIAPLDHPDAFDLGARVPRYLKALRHGRAMRVFRARNIGKDGQSRYFCHPTYE